MELTIEEALQRGVAAHKEGKLQEAEKFYRGILGVQPNHPDANHNLGVLAVSVNKSDAALPLFKTALEANPKIEQFWLSYIDALIKEQQFENAKQVLEQAKMQGVAEEKLNVLEAQLVSIDQTKNANSASPSQELLNSLLGHYQNGRFNDAEKLAVEITQEFPGHQFAWKVLGAVLGATGRKSEAVDANRTAVKLSPQAISSNGNALEGTEIIKDIILAYHFADADPWRAATHNKGIMNAISPIGLACGQDWRAIEAGAHAYAAITGRYRSMTKWWVDEEGWINAVSYTHLTLPTKRIV